MNEDIKNYSGTGSTECLSSPKGELQRLVTLPPYVEAKHRKLVADAERALDEYRAILLSRIEKKLFWRGERITPTDLEIEAAQMEFLSDPMLQHLTLSLGKIKLLVEQPRFMIKPM